MAFLSDAFELRFWTVIFPGGLCRRGKSCMQGVWILACKEGQAFKCTLISSEECQRQTGLAQQAFYHLISQSNQARTTFFELRATSMVVCLGKRSLFLVSWLSSGSQHHAVLKVWGGGAGKRSVGADFVNIFFVFPIPDWTKLDRSKRHIKKQTYSLLGGSVWGRKIQKDAGGWKRLRLQGKMNIDRTNGSLKKMPHPNY